jgi:hypothetical protein
METVVLAIALVSACAAYTSSVAESKGHNSGSWFIGGLFFGPLALIASSGLPDLKARKYLRLLAEHHGVEVNPRPPTPPEGEEDADAQRRRILGGQ